MLFILLSILGCIVFLFSSWKIARYELFSERTVFDACVILFVVCFIVSRVVFGITHFDQFGYNIARYLAFYAYPGFSFGGSIIGFGLSLGVFSTWKTYVPFEKLSDLLSKSFLFSLPLFLLGEFFSGSQKGREILLWSLKEHPVGLYKLLVVIILIGLYLFRGSLLSKKPGIFSLVFWPVFSGVYFFIDFLKVFDVYYSRISIDQWVYLATIIVCAIGAGNFYFNTRKKI